MTSIRIEDHLTHHESGIGFDNIKLSGLKTEAHHPAGHEPVLGADLSHTLAFHDHLAIA